MTIELIENKDILASVCQLNKKPICIGFAAETENFIDNARAKLASKQCEAIILNDVLRVKLVLIQMKMKFTSLLKKIVKK